jgi:D-alanyl-D-alanine carboxypeptidase
MTGARKTARKAPNRRPRKKVPLRRSRQGRNRGLSTLVFIGFIAVLVWAMVAPGRAELRRRQEWKRIGSCKAVSAASPTVSCSGVKLVQLELPRSFAACTAIKANNNGVCTVPVNARVYQRFADAVHQIDDEGLGRYVKTFGTVNRRRCKDAISGTFIRGCISKHSYGIAADVRPFEDNARWSAVINSQPQVQRMINIFIAHGFKWGQNFRSNPDPQHVEWTP